MKLKLFWIGFYTLLMHEIARFCRIWRETLIPPLITMALYYIIFGHLIGSQLGSIKNFSYMQYISPGLIMMPVVTGSFINTVTSLYLLRFQKAIEEITVSPLPNSLVLLAFVLGGVIRGFAIGGLVMLLSLFFTKVTIHHIGLMLLTILLTSVLFSLAGFINGLLARSFDDISIIPTFVLTPLTYFGGVFYSIHMLPAIWQKLSLINPILYLVNAFRYSLLGITDIPISQALWVLLLLIFMLIGACMVLLNKGVGIRQ
jgi:ABC-2 type transport system permease protein